MELVRSHQGVSIMANITRPLPITSRVNTATVACRLFCAAEYLPGLTLLSKGSFRSRPVISMVFRSCQNSERTMWNTTTVAVSTRPATQ